MNSTFLHFRYFFCLLPLKRPLADSDAILHENAEKKMTHNSLSSSNPSYWNTLQQLEFKVEMKAISGPIFLLK